MRKRESGQADLAEEPHKEPRAVVISEEEEEGVRLEVAELIVERQDWRPPSVSRAERKEAHPLETEGGMTAAVAAAAGAAALEEDPL